MENKVTISLKEYQRLLTLVNVIGSKKIFIYRASCNILQIFYDKSFTEVKAEAIKDLLESNEQLESLYNSIVEENKKLEKKNKKYKTNWIIWMIVFFLQTILIVFFK